MDNNVCDVCNVRHKFKDMRKTKLVFPRSISRNCVYKYTGYKILYEVQFTTNTSQLNHHSKDRSLKLDSVIDRYGEIFVPDSIQRPCYGHADGRWTTQMSQQNSARELHHFLSSKSMYQQ